MEEVWYTVGMNISKSVGLGVACWGVMIVAMFVFMAFKVVDQEIFHWIGALIGGIASYWLAGYLRPSSMGQALGYGVIFVVVGVVLDLIVTEKAMPGALSMLPMQVGYVLVLLAPLLQVKKA